MGGERKNDATDKRENWAAFLVISGIFVPILLLMLPALFG